MRTVRQLLDTKSAEIIAIGPDAPVYDAIRLMGERGVGALLVMEGPKLVGILSERDYARKIALQGRSSKDTRVKDIMTRDVLYVTPQTTTSQCMALMSEKKIRHLPVLDGNTVVGMISIRDILDDIIADHEETIAQLENYIRS